MLSQRSTGEKDVSADNEGADHRDYVARSFAEPSGEVREPIRPVRDVLRDPVSRADEFDLERIADTLEHRELERSGMRLRQGQGSVDHSPIVAPHGKMPGSGEQRLEVREIRPVDFGPRAVGDLRRLLDRKSTRLNSSHVRISYAV